MSSADQRIVTLASLQPRTSGSESVAESMEPVSSEDQLNMARYGQVMERLQDATNAAGGDVVITVQDRETSLVQSVVAETATESRPLESGGQEVQFATGISGHDIGWATVLFQQVAHFLDVHPMVRPATAEPETLSVAGCPSRGPPPSRKRTSIRRTPASATWSGGA